MTNEDEYQKFVQVKIRYCLGYHNWPIVSWLQAYCRRR